MQPNIGDIAQWVHWLPLTQQIPGSKPGNHWAYATLFKVQILKIFLCTNIQAYSMAGS